MLWNQHIGTFVGPTFEGLWINQKQGKIHDAMQWYLHCKFYLLFRGIITLQRKLHGIICSNSWYQLKIATKPKIAQEGNKMKYLTNWFELIFEINEVYQILCLFWWIFFGSNISSFSKWIAKKWFFSLPKRSACFYTLFKLGLPIMCDRPKWIKKSTCLEEWPNKYVG
jgi:hypothetical protein